MMRSLLALTGYVLVPIGILAVLVGLLASGLKEYGMGSAPWDVPVEIIGAVLLVAGFALLLWSDRLRGR